MTLILAYRLSHINLSTIFPAGKRILQFYKIWSERGRKTEKVEPAPTSERSLI